MKQRIVMFIVVVISLFSLIAVHAQDTSATPEPGTRADNECYSGGTMAGKCDHGFRASGVVTPDDIAWAWRCGWYIARFNDGGIWREAVPNDCDILLPGLAPLDINTGRVCLAAVQIGSNQVQYCIIGTDFFQVIDSVSGGIPKHMEERMYWVIPDDHVGNGGKCSPLFGGDLSGLSASSNPTVIWAQSVWLNAGFKATDDVCATT